MKITLREKIEKMLSDLIARQEMLDTHINVSGIGEEAVSKSSIELQNFKL